MNLPFEFYLARVVAIAAIAGGGYAHEWGIIVAGCVLWPAQELIETVEASDE